MDGSIGRKKRPNSVGRWLRLCGAIGGILGLGGLGSCGTPYEPLHAPPECVADADPRCPGSLAPDLELEDLNPQSPGFSETRNFASSNSNVRVAAVLAGW